MKVAKNLYWKGENAVYTARRSCTEFVQKKVAGDSNFLAVAVLLIVVVVIGLLFKDQLVALFNSVFGKVTTKVDALF